jgi:hypothetical protein
VSVLCGTNKDIFGVGCNLGVETDRGFGDGQMLRRVVSEGDRVKRSLKIVFQPSRLEPKCRDDRDRKLRTTPCNALLTLLAFLLMVVEVKWCTAHAESSRTHGGPALANRLWKQRPRTLVNSAP